MLSKTVNLDKSKKITDLADICYVRQKEQKGLGDAIRCGERHITGEPFAVLLEDSITKGSVPCTKQLIDIYSKYKSSAISLEEVPVEKVERYRIISGSEVEKNIYKISELVEKPPKEKAPPNLAIMGRYVLTSDIFDSINETEPCISGEIQLTDAPQKLDLI